jgi:Protein of unknown function (DUF3325)
LNTLIAFTLTLAAMTMLCVAMDKHRAQVWGQKPSSKQRLSLRVLGWLLLAAACAFCMKAFGVGIGLVMWFALLNTAGLLLAFVLPYRPRVLANRAARGSRIDHEATGHRAAQRIAHD